MSMPTLRVALMQVNVTVGDISGNKLKILEKIAWSRRLQADLVVFPEMAITGYPPEDLLLKPYFIRAAKEAMEAVAQTVHREVVLLGGVDSDFDIYNTMAVLHAGQIVARYRKRNLPTYGVFDEDRYFRPGTAMALLDMGVRIGLSICEDLWLPSGVCKDEAFQGRADVLVNISASPYQRGKTLQRERMFQTRALDYGCPVLVCNLVGGQDELVFDGNSAVFDSDGSIPAKAKAFEEDTVVFDLKVPEPFRRQLRNPRLRKEPMGIDGSCNGGMGAVELPNALTAEPKPPLPPVGVSYPLSDQEEVLEALKLGLKDYVTKNGFSRVVVGLSGGIDSALVASLAVLTLGKENVLAVSMPSRFTSELSFRCIRQLSENLGVEVWSMPIDKTFSSYLADLEPHFHDLPHGTAEENIQARIRGNLLMAVSNKLGYLVLATGNKSELSVGYCTLYGDLAGGFALIKDVPKTLVYELAHLVNQKAGFSLIPEEVIFRPPSAELKQDQKDEDSLPPYRDLDTILHAYVEEDASLKEIVGLGFSEEVVRRVIRMVDSNEYKRRQAPPGVKITPKAFGKDRRMPITQRLFVE